MARLAGVSIATVSRVVSGTGQVWDATRARVEEAIAVTGWTADPASRLLAGGRGDQVVLVIGVPRRPEFVADPHYARVVTGAMPALTTVRRPVEELAALAVRTLAAPAAARPPEQRLPTHLVVRGSSASSLPPSRCWPGGGPRSPTGLRAP